MTVKDKTVDELVKLIEDERDMSVKLLKAFDDILAELEDKRKRASKLNVCEANGYTMSIKVIKKYLERIK